jgi:hypothetical protein
MIHKFIYFFIIKNKVASLEILKFDSLEKGWPKKILRPNFGLKLGDFSIF